MVLRQAGAERRKDSVEVKCGLLYERVEKRKMLQLCRFLLIYRIVSHRDATHGLCCVATVMRIRRVTKR